MNFCPPTAASYISPALVAVLDKAALRGGETFAADGVYFFAPNGWYPNFCPPTLASYMRPVLVAVKIATPFS